MRNLIISFLFVAAATTSQVLGPNHAVAYAHSLHLEPASPPAVVSLLGEKGLEGVPVTAAFKTNANGKRTRRQQRWGGSGDGPITPSNSDRQFTCPIRYNKADIIAAGYHPSTTDLRSVHIDTTTLPRVVPELAATMNNTLFIMIKRAVEDDVPYFKYMTASPTAYDDPKETWSSSKIFAAMNGAGKLREKCGKGDANKSGSGGLTEFVKGKMGTTPLGDLVSVICNYEEDDYTSNSLANWFEMVGGRERMNTIVKAWLHSNSSNDCSLGAGYGMAPPSDLLEFNFYPPSQGCHIDPDSPTSNLSNTLSVLQAAELTKRITMARELPNEVMPSTTWDDTEVLLYGAQPGTSVLFPKMTFGGMSSCEFPVNTFGVDLARIDEISGGMWRAFGKDGYGCSSSRHVEERLFNGYACYPFEKNANNASEARREKGPLTGVEFIYSTRLSIPSCPETSDTIVEKVMAKVNAAIVDGRIQ